MRKLGLILSGVVLLYVTLVSHRLAAQTADIIAVPGNPLQDIKTLEHAGFVMKGGTVVVNDKPAK